MNWKNLFETILQPRQLALVFMVKTSKLWKDEPYVQMLHWIRLGKRMDLKNPKTYNEKCNWMKLHYHQPVFTQMVDKYEVKKIVADKIGEEHVAKCYGVWDSFDEIDFSKLPKQFVLKCTHDSGSVTVVKDKDTMDMEAVRKKMEKGLKRYYFLQEREWPYKNVKRRILAEEYIPGLGAKESIEYKLTCIDGKVKFTTICGGIAHQALELRTNDHFDRDWNRMDWYSHYKPVGGAFSKPRELDNLIKFSEELSQGIPLLRVDWYVADGKIYFGEFTFYTWAGFCNFKPEKWNNILGSWINLPDANA